MRFARLEMSSFRCNYSCQSLDKVLQHATICNLLASVGTFSRWNCQGHMQHIARTSGSWFAPLPLEAFPSSMVNSLHHTQILWIMAGHGRCPRSIQIPDPWPMVRLSYAKLFSGWSFPGWLRPTVSAGPTEVQSPLSWSLPASMKNHESFWMNGYG